MDPKYPPGSDLISKLVLRNPDMVEMITITLIDPNAASLYLPRPTEWASGSKSDIVYAANVSSTSLPLILIEVQHTITTEFIDRLFNYSLSVKNALKPNQLLLYLAHMLHILKSVWILNQQLLSLQKESPVNIGLKNHFFFPSQKLSLLSSEFRDDPTIQKLYSIAKEQTSTRIPAENDGLLYTETCKHSLVEPMPPPPELSELAKSLMNQSSSNIDILRAEADLPKTDMEYVQQFKESEEKLDWKKCFEGGKKEVIIQV
ncbi:hypothetical protein K501DRAFT_297583 [Backusella circina FSU 941]|nr:hypothetical protein K501DRAFT_297583 [Backusella circina FSU 941]